MRTHGRAWSPIRTAVSLIFFWTSVGLCADGFEEVTYEDLLTQLSQKKSLLQSNNNSPFDKIMFHAGFGLITSAATVKIDGREQNKYQNGFQISLGVDLFSDVWAAEGVIRNFGTSYSGSETRSLREFDLKVLYRNRLNAESGLRYGAGLGTRYFKITDDASGLAINDATPVTTLFGGMDTYLSKSLSLGVEVGARAAMITRTIDKNSIDVTLRLDTYF